MKKHALSLLLIFFSASAMQQEELKPEIISTFKIAQTIFEQWKEIAAQERQNGCNLTLPESLQPEPSRGQTQQGLRLIIRGYPRYMESPWGLLTLCIKAEYPNPNCFDTPAKTLLKLIQHEEEGKLSSWENDREADPVLSPEAAGRIGMFPPAMQSTVARQLQNYKEFLHQNPGIIIKILSTQSDVCTPAITSPRENYRDQKTVMAEWQALETLAKNDYVVPILVTPKTIKSPKNNTLPSLAMLPTAEPSSPTPDDKKCSLM